MIDDAVTEAGRDRTTLVGIGVGVTGYFIGDGARLNPPRLLDLGAGAARYDPGRRAGAEGLIDNDGNVAVIGEAMLGHGRTSDFCLSVLFRRFRRRHHFRGCLAGTPWQCGEFASILPVDWPQPNLRPATDLRGDRYAVSRSPLDARRLRSGTSGRRPVAGSQPAVAQSSGVCDFGNDRSRHDRAGWPFADLTGLADCRAHSFTTNPERRGFHRPAARIAPSMIGGDAAAVGAATMPLRAAFFDPDAAAFYLGSEKPLHSTARRPEIASNAVLVLVPHASRLT
ncbi:unnamed protein product [Acanthosepion pharaonis]|uniref:Uncharacterized protein n=1 Tax=Acanthosepion pharaonis TaxID=158019 RepID=A0A812DIH4_ACAPH|nr:unnamed protein product [Sepia pharaonis]